jgi:predicted transposase YbfD/YdcC
MLMDTQPVPTLAAVLAQVPDPRRARGRRHPWPALLLLLVVALLCGANTQQACARWAKGAGWARLRRLGFTRRGGPRGATVHRVLRQGGVAELETHLGRWLAQVRAAWPHGPCRGLDGIAIDGKTLRGARRLGARDVHLLRACCQRHALVLGQRAVPDTTNELGAILPFLARLPLAGETVTFDAEFTQWLVAQQVVTQGGAYLMAVKANQPTLLQACAAATAAQPQRPRRRLGQTRTVQLAHGRLDARTLLAVAAPPDLGFPHARQVLCLHRRRVDKRTGAVLTDETVYAVTSLGPEQASPAQLLRLWRRHWWVENRAHRVRAVVFGEDANTTHSGTAPQAFAALRSLALSLLHRWRHRNLTAARQYYASHPAALFRCLQLAPAGL